MIKVHSYLLFLILFSCSTLKKQEEKEQLPYDQPHRPQVHFSPKQKWNNDPNGMVYFNDKYHLFFQYYPDSTIWGPMHWGHAISKDLIHWQEQPIALYPDTLGQIFSGSIVVDSNNTSGFGKNGKIPLVAIFTHHDAKGAKAGAATYQNQSLAYSLDEGITWVKHDANPVLKNPGIKDFRDPKVIWYTEEKKWVMTLATKDRITFYSSNDLKSWIKESEFGQSLGAHGGVWECPDLFPLQYEGKTIWVLIISLNPGAPNGGSGTQYFTGHFDGKAFTPLQTDTRWLDYGPDNYAGVSWSNTGQRKILLGWMSNWAYARLVPTLTWRGAMTMARDLRIEKVGDKLMVASKIVPEVSALEEKSINFQHIEASSINLTEMVNKISSPAKLRITSDKIESFTLLFSNTRDEKIKVGFDKEKNQYFIDRSLSGEVNFHKNFPAILTAPRLVSGPNLEFTLIIDNASIELLADDGLSAMTAIFFPGELLSALRIQSEKSLLLRDFQYTRLKSIWK